VGLNRTLIIRVVLGIGIGIALLWVVVPRIVTWSQSAFSRNAGDVEIWIADRYIPAYSAVSRKQLRAVRWPRAYVPPGALLSQDPLSDERDRPRFSAAVAIPEGQPLTRTLLFEAGQGDSLATLLRPGQSAVSFEVDRARGAGGWVKPGDTIAVFFARPDMRLMIPSITVLAVDGKRLSTAVEPPSVKENENELLLMQTQASSLVITVRANPIEAASLIKATDAGRVHLIVRSAGDELPWPMAN